MQVTTENKRQGKTKLVSEYKDRRKNENKKSYGTVKAVLR